MRASGTNWYSTSSCLPLPRGLRTMSGVGPWCWKKRFSLLTILRVRFAFPSKFCRWKYFAIARDRQMIGQEGPVPVPRDNLAASPTNAQAR